MNITGLLQEFMSSEGLTHFLQHVRNITPEEFNTKFHEYVTDSNDQCSICHEIMNSYVKTDCKHKFHKECLRKWLFETQNCQTNCPICRAEIKTDNQTEQNIREKFNTIVNSINDASQAFEDISTIIGNHFQETGNT